MTTFYIYKKWECKKKISYHRKLFSSKKKALKDAKGLTIMLSRMFSGHLIIVKTRTTQGTNIAVSAKFPLTTESLLSFFQMPETHSIIVDPEDRLKKYEEVFLAPIYPFTVCLC